MSGDASGAEIERTTGINQSNVSRWLNDGTAPSPAHAAKLAQAYKGNVLEAFVAAGFLSEEEAGMPPRQRVDFHSIVDDDDALSDNAKIHLKNQYGLLRSASAHARTAEEIAADPDLDEETRARLLARLRVDIVYSSSAMVVEHPMDGASVVALEQRLDNEQQPVAKAARKTSRRGSKSEPGE